MNGSFPRAMPLDAPDDIRSGSPWRNIALIIVGALLAAGVAAWLGYRNHLGAAVSTAPKPSTAPSSPMSQAIGSSGSTDQYPEVARVDLPAAASGSSATQLAWPIWEFRLRQPLPPRNPSLTPPTWRLIGSSFSGGKWSIIVLRQGNTAPEYFSVGQELPGGYRIEAINDQDVTLLQGKREMVLSYIGSR